MTSISRLPKDFSFAYWNDPFMGFVRHSTQINEANSAEKNEQHKRWKELYKLLAIAKEMNALCNDNNDRLLRDAMDYLRAASSSVAVWCLLLGPEPDASFPTESDTTQRTKRRVNHVTTSNTPE